MPKGTSILRLNEKLLGDLRDLIQETRQSVARNINSALVMLYWRVGQRIRKDILEEKRADYGEKIVPTVSTQLGWSHFVKDELQKKFMMKYAIKKSPKRRTGDAERTTKWNLRNM